MQRVRFPVLGSADGGGYLKYAAQILEKIHRERASEKALRRWMRGEGIYDKATFEDLQHLLDFKLSGSGWALGGWAQAFVETSEPAKRQDMIFERITLSNEILAKYVFDALQERLYSTNEIYRMLTSYVYPGKEVDLPYFQHWLKWVEATDRIRVLGIRWALGQRFEDSARYIASIDVDELLEEEAEEELLADAAAPSVDAAPEAEASASAQEGGVAAAPSTAQAPAPSAVASEPAPVESTPSVGWEPPEDDEDEADAPTTAPRASTLAAAPASGAIGAVSAQALASALAVALREVGGLGGGAQEVIEARLLEPAPQASALAAGVPMERVRAALSAEPAAEAAQWVAGLTLEPETQAENVTALLSWWSEESDRPLTRADQAGIMPFGAQGWESGGRARFLFRLSCLAVSLLRGESGQGEASFGVLDGAGFFARLFDTPDSVERLLDELFEQGLGGRAALFAQLHRYLMLARSLRGAEDWCGSLEAMDADALLAALWQRLAAYSLDLEVIWVAREMSMFGLWRHEGLRAVRVVPTEEARRAAFHLGLLESARAPSLPALLAASRRLTPLMGAELEGPLVTFWRTYGAHPPRRFRVR